MSTRSVSRIRRASPARTPADGARSPLPTALMTVPRTLSIATRTAGARLLGLLALLLALAPEGAQAQSSRASLPPVSHSRIVSVNPLLLVFVGSISADYEQRVASSVSLGASVSSFDLSKANYFSVEGRARYYLSGRALDGFAVGASLGVVNMSADETDETQTGMSIGFTLEHQWLVGPEERLALAAGAGASRLFGTGESDVFKTVLPSLRLSLGWGF